MKRKTEKEGREGERERERMEEGKSACHISSSPYL